MQLHPHNSATNKLVRKYPTCTSGHPQEEKILIVPILKIRRSFNVDHSIFNVYRKREKETLAYKINERRKMTRQDSAKNRSPGEGVGREEGAQTKETWAWAWAIHTTTAALEPLSHCPFPYQAPRNFSNGVSNIAVPHPLQPLLVIELFLEVRGEELVSFQSPAHGNSCLNQFPLSKQVTHHLANLNPKHMVENGHLDAMMKKMKKAVSLMANPGISFSTSKPTSKLRHSTSSP
jgi:hypothetical protein